VSAFLATPYYGNATTISQWFGSGHGGIDFLLRYERILAAAGGVITHIGWWNEDDRCLNIPSGDAPSNCGYGLYVEIAHSNDYDTIYGHLSTAIGSTSGPGSIVYQGDVIGTSGDTGWSTGPHLHFEVQHNNTAVDPFSESGVSLWLHGACTATQGNRCSGTPWLAPVEVGSITIDDGDSGFSKECVEYPSCPYWHYDNTVGYNGDMWYTQGMTAPDYQANWHPTISTANQGMYKIDLHIPSDHNTTLKAKYTVNHTYGSDTALVVQAALPDSDWPNSTWVNIGTYFLSPGNASVKITDEIESWGTHPKYVGVDAVRFTRLTPTYLVNTRHINEWDTDVVVRANGGSALTHIEYFDPSGNSECSVFNTVTPAGT
jgi:murein DD-endopeptidase MepM/ murein hydrolase activator NlpD